MKFRAKSNHTVDDVVCEMSLIPFRLMFPIYFWLRSCMASKIWNSKNREFRWCQRYVMMLFWLSLIGRHWWHWCHQHWNPRVVIMPTLSLRQSWRHDNPRVLVNDDFIGIVTTYRFQCMYENKNEQSGNVNDAGPWQFWFSRGWISFGKMKICIRVYMNSFVYWNDTGILTLWSLGDVEVILKEWFLNS